MDPLTLLLLFGGGWLLFGKKTPVPQVQMPTQNVENTPTIFYSQPVAQPSAGVRDVLDPQGISPDTAVWYTGALPWVDPTWNTNNPSAVVQTGFIPGRAGAILQSAVALGGLGCGCNRA